MSVRPPLLSDKQESILKEQILENWYQKDESGNFVFTAKTLADKLQFGVPETPYAKLHPFNIYAYRHQWSDKEPTKFPNRRNPPFRKHRHRYKEKQEEEMSIAQFFSKLDVEYPRIPNTYSSKVRTYVILHYDTPLRRGELLARTIKDFEVKRKYTRILLTLHLQREKKKYEIEGEEEPLTLSLAVQSPQTGEWQYPFPEMQEVLEYLTWKKGVKQLTTHKPMKELIEDFEQLQAKNFEGSMFKQTKYLNAKEPHVEYLRLWNVCGSQAYRWISSIWKNGYPHMFRARFVTDLLNQGYSKAQVANICGMTLNNVDHYFNKPETVQIRAYDNIAERRLEQAKK